MVARFATGTPAREASDPSPPRSVLILGSGPVVIGQAAEFDYAGTQACRALREEGIRTILLNPNPATIMTDPGVADAVYLEPLTVQSVAAILERERVDGVLAGLGGQTALNLAIEASKAGILERYGARLLGTSVEAIEMAEDRQRFRRLLEALDQPFAPSPSSRVHRTQSAIWRRAGRWQPSACRRCSVRPSRWVVRAAASWSTAPDTASA